MLTKLKFAGVWIEDPIDIYSLFILSCAEYCSVAFPPSLTNKQSQKLEKIQRTPLKIILSDSYVDNSATCWMTCLLSLAERRQNRMLSFTEKYISHTENSRFFPRTENMFQDPQMQYREKYKFNFAHWKKVKQKFNSNLSEATECAWKKEGGVKAGTEVQWIITIEFHHL